MRMMSKVFPFGAFGLLNKIGGGKKDKPASAPAAGDRYGDSLASAAAAAGTSPEQLQRRRGGAADIVGGM